MPKHRIRQMQLQARSCLSAQQRVTLSIKAQQKLLSHPLFVESQVLALYAPIRCEVDTCLLLDAALAAGKRVLYPRVGRSNSTAAYMEFVEVSSFQDLRLGTFSVLEPQGRMVVAVGDIDLMVVPGVAFDRCGHRLGYGKGFYDRAAQGCSLNCVLLGLGYAFQVETELPHEEHDLVLDWLITDREVLKFSNNIK